MQNAAKVADEAAAVQAVEAVVAGEATMPVAIVADTAGTVVGPAHRLHESVVPAQDVILPPIAIRTVGVEMIILRARRECWILIYRLHVDRGGRTGDEILITMMIGMVGGIAGDVGVVMGRLGVRRHMLRGGIDRGRNQGLDPGLGPDRMIPLPDVRKIDIGAKGGLDQNLGHRIGMIDDSDAGNITAATTAADTVVRPQRPRKPHPVKHPTDENLETVDGTTAGVIVTTQTMKNTGEGSVGVVEEIDGGLMIEIMMIGIGIGTGIGIGSAPAGTGDVAPDLPLLMHVHGRALGLIQT